VKRVKSSRRTTTTGKAIAPSENDEKQPRGSGAQHVYEGLREAILNLTMRPGTMLDETEIGIQFGVSRSPVREAIIRLAAEGLVDTLRNRGAMVAPFDIDELPGYFEALKIAYRLTARGAARRARPSDIEELSNLLTEHEAVLASGDHMQMISMNRTFHQRLAEIAGNRWIMEWQRSLLDHGQRVLRMHATHFGGTVPTRQLSCHREMLEAIAAADEDAADRAAAADAVLVRDRMIAFMTSDSGAIERLD
jgi:DNA-binding GntR family transcriptional regulator